VLAEHTLRAQVLVDVGPVNAESSSSHPPVRALLGRRDQQARIPGQGHGNRAPVQQIDDQDVFGEPHILDALTGRRSEVIIPRSSNRCSCSSINLWMWPQLNRGESNVTRQCDRRQPGLGRLVVSVNVFAYEGAARAAVALAAGLWPSEAPTLPADGAAEQARPRQTPALGVRSPGAGD
jgi:hypothetical protein